MPGMVDLASGNRLPDDPRRVLDRRRLELLLGRGDGAGVLAALAAYRNADGGYGWGLEPDLRVPGSQPAGALHAFETLAEAGGDEATAAALCDWLDRVALPDGGLPFALPDDAPPGFAGPWRGADPHASSLHITAAVCEPAHRVPAAAGHPWLARATAFCVAALRAQDEPGGSYELKFSLGLLDAIGAQEDLERHARHLPRSGVRGVAGGIEGEALRPLDFSRGRAPLRALLAPDAIEADLDRLAAGQHDDGGWTIDFQPRLPRRRARVARRLHRPGDRDAARERAPNRVGKSFRGVVAGRRREPHKLDLFSRVR